MYGFRVHKGRVINVSAVISGSRSEMEARAEYVSPPYFLPRNENSAARLILTGVVLALLATSFASREPPAVQFKRRHAASRHRRKGLAVDYLIILCLRRAIGTLTETRRVANTYRRSADQRRRRAKVEKEEDSTRKRKGLFCAQRPRLCA